MYKTRYQAEYNDYVQRYGRDWKLSVSPFNSNMIMNFKYEGILGDSKTFTLGANATNIIDIEVYFPDGNENSFKGTTLEPILELRTEVLIENVLTEVWQEVPLGKFIVSEVSRQNTSTILLTAVDKMSHDNYGNKIYESNISFPTNTISLLRDVAGRMSCSIENENDVPNFPIKEKKKINGKPLRKVLSYIACLYGGFVKINRKGNIEFFKTYDTGIKYDTNGGIKKITEGEPIMSISGIKCQISPTEFIQVGTISETETIEIINYDMTKENLNSIFDYYKGKKYYSVIYDGMINPALDPGDIITVSNMQGVDKKIMNQCISWTFTGGPQGEYQCDYNLEDEEWDTQEDRMDELQDYIDEINDNMESMNELENKSDYLESAIEQLQNESVKQEEVSELNDRIYFLENRIAILENQILKCINCNYVNGSSSEIIPTKISGLEDKTIKVGNEIALTAVLSPSDSNKSVAWSVGDSSVIKIVTAGVVCRIKGLKKGTSTLTCASNKADMVSQTVTITVKDDSLDIKGLILLDCGSPRTLTIDGENRLLDKSTFGGNSWTSPDRSYLNSKGLGDLCTEFWGKGVVYKFPSNLLPNSDSTTKHYLEVMVSVKYTQNNGGTFVMNYANEDMTKEQYSLDVVTGFLYGGGYRLFNKYGGGTLWVNSTSGYLTRYNSSLSPGSNFTIFRLEFQEHMVNAYPSDIGIFIGCTCNYTENSKDKDGNKIVDGRQSSLYSCVDSVIESLVITYRILD